MSQIEAESIRKHFEQIIEEMRDGMCFFVGYIFSIDESVINKVVSSLAARTESTDLYSSVWCDDLSEEEWQSNYSINEFLNLYEKDESYGCMSTMNRRLMDSNCN